MAPRPGLSQRFGQGIPPPCEIPCIEACESFQIDLRKKVPGRLGGPRRTLSPCRGYRDRHPRYPPLPAIMGAKKKPHEVLALADLGVDPATVGAAGAGTKVGGLSRPEGRGDTVLIEDDGSAAEKIMEFLVEKKVVA